MRHENFQGDRGILEGGHWLAGLKAAIGPPSTLVERRKFDDVVAAAVHHRPPLRLNSRAEMLSTIRSMSSSGSGGAQRAFQPRNNSRVTKGSTRWRRR